MALDSEVPDQYYTFEGRLASFLAAQPVNRRRSVSTKAAKGPKSLSWPHKQLDPAALARAGFYFEPTPEFPDNVVCYLCLKRVGGWEVTDDPLEEHLRLSNGCGWAIVTAIEAGLGDYGADDPSNVDMMDARKQTFIGRWPHEGKKGWKCKVKQMVDAGWKYTPTPDSDDMATCTYCQLALDGWEPSDKPMDEHYKRSSSCPFFTLINQYQQAAPAKKTARGKGARTSKATQLSVAPEAPPVREQPEDYEDSVMANTSVATVGGTKRAKAKKTTTTKAKKTRGKKNEPIEVLEDPREEEQPPPPPPKPTRGRKRASDSIDDSVLTNAEAPAPKKRATRARQSNAVDTSSLLEDQTMLDAPATKPAAKKGQAKSRKPRKLSTASFVSAVEAPEEQIPDDDELDRQLQADLDRPMPDNETAVQPDSEKKAPATKGRGKKATAKKNSATKEELSSDHAMFDPAPMEVDDDDISAELTAMRMEAPAEEPEPLQVPKRGRKPGARKASKQTKAEKVKQPVAEQEPELEASPKPEPESVIVTKIMPAPADPMSEDELSFDATVLTTSSTAGPRKRGRPRKSSVPPVPVVQKGKPGRPSKASRANAAEERRGSSIQAAPAAQSPVKEELPPAPADEKEPEEDVAEEILPEEEAEAPEEVEKVVEMEEASEEEEEALEGEEEAPAEDAVEEDEAVQEREAQEEPEAEAVEEEMTEEEIAAEEEAAEEEGEEVVEEEEVEEIAEEEAQRPATPAPATSPAPSAKQSAVSPSQSPQSSDAENRPPSSKPSNTANSSRVADVTVAETPSRASPSKQDANYLRNLESTQPWQAVDLDLVFEDLNKENAANPLLPNGQQQLTSPEKKMTVEEWIQHNAALAEGTLKNECEAMVSKFEQEGGRAMRVLEELVVE